MGETERLIDLGEHVAGAQARAAEATLDRARGRARFVAGETAKRRLDRRWLVAAIAFAAAGLVVFFLRPRPPIAFDLGASSPGAVGAWIAAPANDARSIRFSDGTRLELAAGGRARVTSIDADGAALALERGALELAVVHRDRTKWSVSVGPFAIHVVGTRFSVRWDPDAEELEVSLHEGAVTVSGPVVGEARAIKAGERLVVRPAAGTLEVGADVSPVASTAPSVRAIAIAPSAEPSAAPSSRPSASASVEAPAYQSLARASKYKEAVSAAEREGFETICATASASDLRLLGDAARLSGNAARASEAFLRVRARFAGSPDAATSAFLLGRMAQDNEHDSAGAARWFATYLREQPGGAFAGDASGRLVEVNDALGDREGARAAAERYLDRWPSGSHAGFARRVLDRSDAGR